jgi:hypothetical protein
MEPSQVDLLKQNIVDVIDACKNLDTQDNKLDIFMYLNDIITTVGDLAHDIDPKSFQIIDKLMTAIEAGQFD